MSKWLGLVVLVAGMIAAEPALADKKIAPDEIRALVTSGELMSLDEILRRNETQISGRVIDLHLERKRGIYIYDIKVLRTDGRYARIEIDARTGLILPSSKKSD